MHWSGGLTTERGPRITKFIQADYSNARWRVGTKWSFKKMVFRAALNMLWFGFTVFTFQKGDRKSDEIGQESNAGKGNNRNHHRRRQHRSPLQPPLSQPSPTIRCGNSCRSAVSTTICWFRRSNSCRSFYDVHRDTK